MGQPISVFLVGPMGAGKSTIGKLLASELKLPFRDVDREIEERCGADISWIFDVEGEEGFRLRETGVIDDLSQLEGVLATGGGSVLKEVNRYFLSSRGQVVYLTINIDFQLDRTARDKKRPLLQTDDPRQILQKLQQARDPLYREVADIVVSTDHKTPKEVCVEIISKCHLAET